MHYRAKNKQFETLKVQKQKIPNPSRMSSALFSNPARQMLKIVIFLELLSYEYLSNGSYFFIYTLTNLS